MLGTVIRNSFTLTAIQTECDIEITLFGRCLTYEYNKQVHNCCKRSKHIAGRKGKIKKCKLRKGLTGFNDHIKTLRFLTIVIGCCQVCLAQVT